MAQASLTSQNPASLNTVDSVVWSKIIGGVIGMISLILEDHGDQHLIDRMTIVRGFGELSLMYPNNVAYRQSLTESLRSLSEALWARDDLKSATQVKSLHDRCRKFDESVLKADNGLTLHGSSSESRGGFAANTAHPGCC